MEFRPDGALMRHRHENPDGSASESIHEYDACGRLMTVRDGGPGGLANTSIYEYDTDGRMQRMIRRPADGGERVAQTYEYSADGLKQKTDHLEFPEQIGCGAISWMIEGTDGGYSATGAAAIVLRYDPRGQPVEATFTGRDGRVLARVNLIYDTRGLLIGETQTVSEVFLPEEARV